MQKGQKAQLQEAASSGFTCARSSGVSPPPQILNLHLHQKLEKINPATTQGWWTSEGAHLQGSTGAPRAFHGVDRSRTTARLHPFTEQRQCSQIKVAALIRQLIHCVVLNIHIMKKSQFSICRDESPHFLKGNSEN